MLNVYNDPDYRGRPYSRFLLEGRPYASTSSGLQGSETVSAGLVEVRQEVCHFTLSPVEEGYGVILYRVGLKRVVDQEAEDLYAVRARLAEAIEALQAAIEGT